MSEVNIPLLRKAVEWVEAEALKPISEREWYQASWRRPETVEVWDEVSEKYVAHCGTAYCVAGYVGQLVNPEYQKSDWLKNEGGTPVMHVSTAAKEALGLTTDQADRLFDAGNDVKDVRRIAEEIAGERL